MTTDLLTNIPVSRALAKRIQAVTNCGLEAALERLFENVSRDRRRFQAEVLTGAEASLHEVCACGSVVFENGRFDDARLTDSHVDSPPPVESLVAGRRPAAIGEITAPATFDPARNDGCVWALAKDEPNSLAEAVQQLIISAAHATFGKHDNAFTSIQSHHGLAQLRRLAPKLRGLHANGVYHAHHEPAQNRFVVENTCHHRCDSPRQDLGDPNRIDPGAMIGHDQDRPL